MLSSSEEGLAYNRAPVNIYIIPYTLYTKHDKNFTLVKFILLFGPQYFISALWLSLHWNKYQNIEKLAAFKIGHLKSSETGKKLELMNSFCVYGLSTRSQM